MCEVQLALFREKETILEMAEAVKLNVRRVSGGQQRTWIYGRSLLISKFFVVSMMFQTMLIYVEVAELSDRGHVCEPMLCRQTSFHPHSSVNKLKLVRV